MEIKYFGWESFRIQEGRQVVLTQPFLSSPSTFLFPKTKAGVILSSGRAEKNLQKRISGINGKSPFWAPGPGEYEISGVEVRGFSGGYWFQMKSVQLAFWWGWEEKEIKNLVSEFPNINILFLRVDQEEKGFAKKIKDFSQRVSPAFIIPFCSSAVKKEEFIKNEWAKPFLDALDQEDIKSQEKLVVSREELDNEELKAVLLKAKPAHG